jgi:hypothetical protein
LRLGSGSPGRKISSPPLASRLPPRLKAIARARRVRPR